MAWFHFRRCLDANTPSVPFCHHSNQAPRQTRFSMAVSLSIAASIAIVSGCSPAQPQLPRNAEQLSINPVTSHPWHNARLDRAFLAFKSPVKALALSADGNTLISGSLNGDTRLWNLNTNTAIRSLTDRPAIQSIAVSPATDKPDQAGLFASSDYQGGIELHDLTTGALRRNLVGHSTVVQSVAFSPDGKILASGCWDKTVGLWDVETGNLIHTLTGHSFGVTAVAFVPQTSANDSANDRADRSDSASQSAEEPLLVSADYDGGIKLWRSTSGQLVRTFAADRYPIFSLAISPDGKILVEGSGNGSIKSWKLPSGRYLTNFGGHGDAVTAVAISPDGQTLASGSRDKTIKLWDLSTGNLIQTLSGEAVDSILTLTFSPDGQRLISGDQAGMIQVWQQE